MNFSFKFGTVFVFLLIPFFLFLADYVGHSLAKDDGDSALRQAGVYAMKEGIVKGSLRDTNVLYDRNNQRTDQYRTQYAVNPRQEVVVDTFRDSFTKKSRGTLVNYAERDEAIGVSNSPPMLAIRSSTVRDSLLYSMVGRFVESSGSYVIQNEKIIILEMKETN